MYRKIQKRTFEIFHTSSEQDAVARVISILILVLITFNVCAVILETDGVIFSKYYSQFRLFEMISVLVFTLEYLLRIWSCSKNVEASNKASSRLKLAFSFFMIIDFLAILPFYVPFLIPVDLRILRILRLLRIFRILKLAKYSKALSIIGNVLREKSAELSITAFAFFLLWLVSSCLIYHVENTAQPEAFYSIPAAMWWSIVTLTTVGYGDIVPMTLSGKVIGSFVSISGIVFLALPTAIIGSGFMEELNKKHGRKCPHCGKEI